MYTHIYIYIHINQSNTVIHKCKSIICVGIVVTDLITASIYSTGVIDVLIDIWTHSNTRCYSNLCLLLIRNQCFYQPTKPLLASNGINMCSKGEFKTLSRCPHIRRGYCNS